MIEEIVMLMGIQSAGAVPPEHWIATLTSSNANTVAALRKDSAGNSHIAGTVVTVGDLSGYSMQDTAGPRSEFQLDTGGISGGGRGLGIGFDSSDNAYWLCSTFDVHFPDADIYLLKRNSAGTLQWEVAYGVFVPRGLAVDSSGNSYVAGTTGSGAGLVKFDNAGAVSWATGLSSGTFYAVAVSGSDVYAVGSTDWVYPPTDPSSTSNLYLAKFNGSTGAVSWQRSLGGANKDVGYGVCVDTDGDVVVTGICDSGGTEGILIAKYTSAGTLSWQRKIATGGTLSTGGYVTPGASGTVYVVGTFVDSGTNALLVALIADAGTVTWQRKLRPTSAAAEGKAVWRDSAGLYLAADLSSGYIVAKVPDDGTLTGTHGIYTYGTPTQTDSDPSLTGATPAYTSGSTGAGLSSVTGSYSVGTLSLSRQAVT